MFSKKVRYLVTRRCGHKEDWDIFGDDNSRRIKLRKMEITPCRECAKVERQQNAEKYSTGHGLPALMGTERQVQWAMEIRAEALHRLDWLADRANNEQQEAHVMSWWNRLRDTTSARWWIDHRKELPTVEDNDGQVVTKMDLLYPKNE